MNSKKWTFGASAVVAFGIAMIASPAQAAFFNYSEPDFADAPSELPGQNTGVSMSIGDFFVLSGLIGDGDLADSFEFTYNGASPGQLSLGLGVVPQEGLLGFEIFQNGSSVASGVDPASGQAIGVFSPGDTVGVTFTAPDGLQPSNYTSNVSATAVPTPALLPGLLGFGATILRKRKQAAAIA